MKSRFLCANHREWLYLEPQQAVHCCANAYETGWHLSQRGHWAQAMPHLGCAFETAEILLTTRAIAPRKAVDWFLGALAALTQALENLGRTNTCVDIQQAAIDRLRREATQPLAPELEADLYRHITRLNRECRRLRTGACELSPMITAVAQPRGRIVLH